MLFVNIDNLRNLDRVNGGLSHAPSILDLDVFDMISPDGTTGNVSAALFTQTTADVSAPKHETNMLRFDESTNEHAFWQFELPIDFYETENKIRLRLYFAFVSSQTVAVNTLKWNVSAVSITPNVDTDDLKSIDIDSGGWIEDEYEVPYVTFPSFALCTHNIDISSLFSSSTAGDLVFLALRRDATDAAPGDVALYKVCVEYNY